MLKLTTGSPKETRALGGIFGQTIRPGTVLLLRGDLGSGKTVFVKGLARALGVTGRIKSPSFGILQSYPAQRGSPRSGGAGKVKRLHHLDLYRLQSGRELAELGFHELLRDQAAVVAVEWPDKARRLLTDNTISIKFSHGKLPHERIIHVE